MNAEHPETLTSSTSLPLSLGAWLTAEPARSEIGDQTREGEASRILQAADAILAQAEVLLQTLSAEHYTLKVPVAFNASIGGHLRHCLDHFSSVVRSESGSLVNYDQRERDARIESDLDFALGVTRDLRRKLALISPAELHHAVAARCEVSYSCGSSPITASSLGRELVYCIAHAIHHYALIAVMARLQGTQLPENFGIAPSTVAHQQAIHA